MTRIFISYRRTSSAFATSQIADASRNRFGKNSVFLDTEKIAPGDLFPDRIVSALQETEVFLPLIGIGWTKCADANGFRLMQEDDWVRQEIATALDRHTRGESLLIIPLVESGAELPRRAAWRTSWPLQVQLSELSRH